MIISKKQNCNKNKHLYIKLVEFAMNINKCIPGLISSRFVVLVFVILFFIFLQFLPIKQDSILGEYFQINFFSCGLVSYEFLEIQESYIIDESFCEYRDFAKKEKCSRCKYIQKYHYQYKNNTISYVDFAHENIIRDKRGNIIDSNSGVEMKVYNLLFAKIIFNKANGSKFIQKSGNPADK
ncbi:MAG: hypothetical protein JXR81_06365 [Candidatus Goldbacteria bacterium]|nr:hypothetical protein [Candidatus Goldiibacteriota bacterium]